MTTRIPALCAALAFLFPPAGRADGGISDTPALLAALKSSTNLHDRARACQQLGARGTAEAVPALAALLDDPVLAAYARQGLEGIPGPEPAAALRAALATLEGDRLLGAIDSLGSLRDAGAVALLAGIASGTDPNTARAALRSLGRIGTPEAAAVLRRAMTPGSEATRADAAAATLLAADSMRRAGRGADAAALFDTVRAAPVPDGLRAAAARGSIVARGPAAAPLFAELVRSADRHVRHAALLAVREVPSDALADALRESLGGAAPDLRAQMILAMLDCRNDRSMPAVRGAVSDADAGVRLAALRVLSQAGTTADDAAALAAVLGRDGTADEHALAADGLGRIGGADVDALVLKAVDAAPGADARVRLIQVAGARAAAGASGTLLRHAADPEPRVAVAALRALKSVAGPAELPALIAITKAASNPAVRAAAEGALHGVCLRPDAAGGADSLLAGLTPDATAADKGSWIRVLAALGHARALPALRAAAGDADEGVAACALDQLGRWPDPSPMEDLLAVVESAASPRRRSAAFASAAQLAGAAAAGTQQPDTVVAGWFQRLQKAARDVGEKRLVLAGLARFATAEGLRLLVPHLDDPAVQPEAAWAVVGLSSTVESPADLPALRAALQKVAASKTSGDVRGKAASRLRNLPEPSAPWPLFDGRTLTGWEGATNVWRVRDGAIVGGSMDGNPRNEFLATARAYSNFVLRLEYRLAGTEGFINGGVQFRSTRVAQPPNEMKGYQADIGAGHSGCLYDESRRRKFLARGTDEQIRRLEQPGEWNRLEVRCEGPRIRISMNGELTVDFTDDDAAIPRDGLIALQIHGNCKAEISFRDLSIVPLP
jgi:HEAT repeat protein